MIKIEKLFKNQIKLRCKLVFPDNKHAADFINDTLAKSINKIELKWSNIRIDSLTPTMAKMAASFNEVLTDMAGKKMPMDGYFTALVQHTAEGWQLRNAHWSLEKKIIFEARFQNKTIFLF